MPSHPFAAMFFRACSSLVRHASTARRPLAARALSARPLCTPAAAAPAAAAETVSITFIEDDEEIVVDAELGKSLLEVAHANEIDLEGAPEPRVLAPAPDILRFFPRANPPDFCAHPTACAHCRCLRRLARVLNMPPDPREGRV